MERAPDTYLWVLDLTAQNTLVELPSSIDPVKVKSAKLIHWYVNAGAAQPFFQILFRNAGLVTETATWGVGMIPSAIQVPWPTNTTTVTLGSSNGLPIGHWHKLQHRFNVEVFGSGGALLTPTHIVLWIEIDVEHGL